MIVSNEGSMKQKKINALFVNLSMHFETSVPYTIKVRFFKFLLRS